MEWFRLLTNVALTTSSPRPNLFSLQRHVEMLSEGVLVEEEGFASAVPDYRYVRRLMRPLVPFSLGAAVKRAVMQEVVVERRSTIVWSALVSQNFHVIQFLVGQLLHDNPP